MRRKAASGNVAASITAAECPSAPAVGEAVLTVVLLGHLTPSLNAVNAMHWTRKARLRKRYRALLEGSVSPSSATAREPLTVIIFGEDVSS